MMVRLMKLRTMTIFSLIVSFCALIMRAVMFIAGTIGAGGGEGGTVGLTVGLTVVVCVVVVVARFRISKGELLLLLRKYSELNSIIRNIKIISL